MAQQLEVITKGHHAGKRWRKPKGYSYAASAAVVPIIPSELAHAAPVMPLAFAKEGESFRLVALMSPMPGRNMFVAPNGAWLGTYIPALIRGYPFRLVRNPATDEAALAIDESVGLTSVEEPETEPLFNTDGSPAQTTQLILRMLSQIQSEMSAAERSVGGIAELGLLQPWPLKVQTDKGEQEMTGLYRIDEATMNALPDTDFLKLKAAGALPIAYAHFLSMNQMAVFGRLAQLHAQMAPKPQPNALPESLDTLFGMAPQETIKF